MERSIGGNGMSDRHEGIGARRSEGDEGERRCGGGGAHGLRDV